VSGAMSIFMRLLCVIASLAALTHHREPHRNVEPVEVMLTSGFQCSCTSMISVPPSQKNITRCSFKTRRQPYCLP
jgi:hypothetical protein